MTSLPYPELYFAIAAMQALLALLVVAILFVARPGAMWPARLIPFVLFAVGLIDGFIFAHA